MCRRDPKILIMFRSDFIDGRLQPIEEAFSHGQRQAAAALPPQNDSNVLRFEDEPSITIFDLSSKSGLPAASRSHSELKRFCRLTKNIFKHMTLQNKPTSEIDCLATVFDIGPGDVLAPRGTPYTCVLSDASSVDLVGNASICTIGPVEFDCAEKSTAGQLLLDMMKSGAWGPQASRLDVATQAFYLPNSAQSEDCQILLQKKLITPSMIQSVDDADADAEQFYLTPHAFDVLQLKLTLASQMPLDEYHKSSSGADLSINDLCAFELFMLMLHSGWEVVVSLSRMDFIDKQQQEKQFCIQNHGVGALRVYLAACLQADRILEAGLPQLFHCQSKTYYACALRLTDLGSDGCLKKLEPNKPASCYKELLKEAEDLANDKKNKGSKKRLANAISAPAGTGGEVMELELEDEKSLLEILGESVPKAKQQKKQTSARHERCQRRPISAETAMGPDSGPVQVSSDSSSSGEMETETATENPVTAIRRRKSEAAQATASSRLVQAVATVAEQAAAATERAKQKKIQAPAAPAPAAKAMAVDATDSDPADLNMAAAGAIAGPAQDSASAANGNVVNDNEVLAPVPALTVATAASSAGQIAQPSSSSSSSSSVAVAAAPASAAPARAAAAAPSPAVAAAPGDSAGRRAQGSLSSLFNSSTIWVGDIAIIKREDKGSDSCFM